MAFCFGGEPLFFLYPLPLVRFHGDSAFSGLENPAGTFTDRTLLAGGFVNAGAVTVPAELNTLQIEFCFLACHSC